MSSGNNKVLKELQTISEQTGWNNETDATDAINSVLEFPNKVFFSDLAYFVLIIQPPSGKVIGKTFQVKVIITRLGPIEK